MKRYFFLILAAGAAAVSCQREEAPVDVNTVEQVNLVISTIPQQEPAEDTRTTLVDWSYIRWNPQDEISVFTSVEGAKFTSVNTELAASTQFTGTISVDTAASGDAAWIWALYPYDANAVFADQTITTTLPSNQVAVAGTFDDDLLITAGRARNPFISTGDAPLIMESTGMDATTMYLNESDGSMEANGMGLDGGLATPSTVFSNARVLKMHFEHVCAGIRFTLTKPDIESVTLTANGGEPLAGTFTFAMDNQGMPIVQSVATPSSSVTLTPPNGGTFQTGVWYYFVTLPVTFSQGVTFTLESATQVGTRVGQTAFTLNRGTFMRSTNLDQNIEMEDFEVEVQVAGPDTWVAVDELGRALPTDVRETQTEHELIMYYSPWHCEHMVTYSPIVNVTGVQWFYPEAITNPTHWAWGDYNAAPGQTCFWGEPLYGYYRTTDPWVLRKHAEMLADAGVDAVAFDCSNGSYLWKSSVLQLLSTWKQAKNDGVKVPKVMFMMQLGILSNTGDALRSLYREIYKLTQYDDMWFRVNGKPCVMAYPESLALTQVGDNHSEDPAILNYFTFRPGEGDYVNGAGTDGLGNPKWGWLQVYPQNVFNNGEQMTVGVAQNACDASLGHCYAFNAPDSYGRSHTHAEGNAKLVEWPSPGVVGSFIQGYNFQEQWDRALAVDPKYVFVVGWNEWVAYKHKVWPDANPYYNAGPFGLGYNTDKPWYVGYSFPDLYDAERSRDIEPTRNWGDHGDDYYYQLIQNSRRFKGVGSYPNVSKRVTMGIDGDFTGWDAVSPDFKHYRGNTAHRNHAGHSTLSYSDNTGRNDFVDARVARDNQYIYFYVETDQAITARTDPAWMRLFINIDRDYTTGWKGYDFCLNYRNPSSASTGYVSRNSNNAWSWTDAGTFDYAVNGNKMEIRVSRELLGVSSGKLDFEFKWSDNMQLYDSSGNLDNANGTAWVLDFLVSGDCAPGGRFNFHYKEN